MVSSYAMTSRVFSRRSNASATSLASRVVVALLCVVAQGCSDDSPAIAPGRGVPEAERAQPTSVEPGGSTHPGWASERRVEDDAESAGEVAPTTIEVREIVEQAAPRVRDLGAELRAAFGDPSGCLSSLGAAELRVTITVRGTVFEDGTISGASVGASNANTAVTQCLRAMLPGLRLEGGIPGAPRPVSASIDVAR